MKASITPGRKTPIKRSVATAEQCSYTVGWSQEDEAYVARVTEFPSLAAHGDSSKAALRELKMVVRFVLKDMVESSSVGRRKRAND